MGTHPIFESDFDCLTDLTRNVGRIQKRQRDSLRRLHDWRDKVSKVMRHASNCEKRKDGEWRLVLPQNRRRRVGLQRPRTRDGNRLLVAVQGKGRRGTGRKRTIPTGQGDKSTRHAAQKKTKGLPQAKSARVRPRTQRLFRRRELE